MRTTIISPAALLNLSILRQNPLRANPLGVGFNYAEELEIGQAHQLKN